jgi:predicted hotdog family 3-hydroxylacyl-ACP dehydratase
MDATELPHVSELIPHRGEVLLLDRVLNHDGESTTVRVVVDHQTWLKRENGSVATWVAVEYMAQCIAAHEGIRAHLEGRPPVRGSLATAVGVRLHRSCFEPGELLRVRTQRVRGRPGLGVLSHFCTVHEDGEAREGQLLAEGRLSISIPRSIPPIK